MDLKNLPKTWDLIIIGGGITGAGIFREASRMGLRVLLVEQKDFAWGTSSRSSKLVHGGLRYLKDGHFRMAKIAVAERERLLKEAPGLVESLGFLLPIYEDQSPGRRTMQVGLSLYDIMAKERQHHYYEAAAFIQKIPQINPDGLKGGFHFFDAQVDDFEPIGIEHKDDHILANVVNVTLHRSDNHGAHDRGIRLSQQRA